ncbi:MAG: hypothetical protein K1X36_12495 [Pyrinomonadaceae bacterium]|nr:hypothetical protein [Pyrinomonadaceae bacterium]
MELASKVLAVILLGVAAYFYSAGESDYAFAAAVVGICSFFLSMRFAIKRRLAAAETSGIKDEGGK